MDPCPRSTGYAIGKTQADIVTISHDHPEHAHLEAASGDPLVLRSIGEYEVKNVLVTGVRTYHDHRCGAERGVNTAFVVEAEGLRVCHLGDLGHLPTPDQVEELGTPDVLLVPVGGHSTIDAARAAEVVSLLEPKLAVPMHFRTELSTAELDPPDRFLREMGATGVQPQPKLSLSRSALPAEPQVFLLDYRR